METIGEIIKKGEERAIKNVREHIENQIGLPFLKDETRITMGKLYDSLDEKNARSITNIVTEAVRADRIALSDEDIVRLKKETRFAKQTVLICIIFFLVSLMSYYFVEYSGTFRDALIGAQGISFIIFLSMCLFLLHYTRILYQGHWDN